MKVLEGDNVQTIFPMAYDLLVREGIARGSRNGAVLQYPTPVTTVYHKPWQRVLFWPKRDANPFFHLYEALWMLQGRNDVAGVVKYAANMANYSNDGETFHGAYGYRWRRWNKVFDQLKEIANLLQENPEDRRCVLSMWNADTDLGEIGKDFPCNTIATFQINLQGGLDLTVFCRSNDIIWGAYGANAVQFSMLLEYMAHWIGVPMGKYYQVSVNWHAYTDIIGKIKFSTRDDMLNPYEYVKTIPLASPNLTIDNLDALILTLLSEADSGNFTDECTYTEPFFNMAWHMLKAHYLYKTKMPREALSLLDADSNVDWIMAGQQWILRRLK